MYTKVLSRWSKGEKHESRKEIPGQFLTSPFIIK